jgi:transposase
MTTPAPERDIIGGVDTHGATHHAAAIDAATGRLLGDREFPATAAGYGALLAWLREAGTPAAVGIEGTGSYGAGLFRHLAAAGVSVTEVTRPSRQARRFQGKSDPLDAIAAARAVLAGTAATTPKPRDGTVEAIRMIRATRRSAVKARRAAIGQIHGLLACAPEPLRERLRGYDRAALVTRCAALRPAPAAAPGDPAAVTTRMLRRLARRIAALDTEITAADTELHALTAAIAPHLLAVFGAGPQAAAQLLCTAGENPHRLHSEAALARLCGTAPIPASSGTTTRHRLHRGGDRQANAAIHMIAINRLRWHAPTRAYLARRTTQGKTRKEIIRCLKRAITRELYTALKTDLPDLTRPRPAPAPPLDNA